MFNLRIAITPSGKPHIGNVYIFIINYLIKNKILSNLILRFDDTNNKLNNNVNKIFILKYLNKIGINFSLKINQTNYIYIYIKKLNKFIKKISFSKLFYNNKIKKKNVLYSYFNLIYYCNLLYYDNNFGKKKFFLYINKIINIKKNGISTYNYSSYINDEINLTNLIIRGKDWLNQLYVQFFFNLIYKKKIIWHHLSLIKNINNKKFSKRINSKINNKILNFIKNKKFNFFEKKDIKINILNKKKKIIINKYIYNFLFSFKKKSFYNYIKIKKKKKIINFFFNYNFKYKNIYDFYNINLNLKIFNLKKKYEFT